MRATAKQKLQDILSIPFRRHARRNGVFAAQAAKTYLPSGLRPEIQGISAIRSSKLLDENPQIFID